MNLCTCSKGRRNFRTLRGSSRVKSHGTGGMTGTLMAWIFMQESIRRPMSTTSISRRSMHSLHNSRRWLVQTGQFTGSDARSQHGGTDRLREEKECRADSLGVVEDA